MAAGVDEWPTELTEDEEGELVELPVTYDGPDLESVAEHTGLDVDEVVRGTGDASSSWRSAGSRPASPT